MDFDRFTLAAFESLADDPHAARRLADQLQEAVLAELGTVAAERFQAIVAALNTYGHRLKPFREQSAEEGHVRDYTDPACCALRLAFDLTISAGYKDVRFEGGWGESVRQENSVEVGEDKGIA